LKYRTDAIFVFLIFWEKLSQNDHFLNWKHKKQPITEMFIDRVTISSPCQQEFATTIQTTWIHMGSARRNMLLRIELSLALWTIHGLASRIQH
jgi:hypothetical protein